MIRNLFLTLWLVAFLGCAKPLDLSKPPLATDTVLNIGMAQDQVAVVLGAPSTISSTAGQERWLYNALQNPITIPDPINSVEIGQSLAVVFDSERRLIEIEPNPVLSGNPAQNHEALKSYEECAAAGGKLLRTFPGVCIAPNGEKFAQQTPSPGILNEIKKPAGEKSCRDLCGDGRCQEIVCLALGCPCPENSKNCPQDCKS